MKESEIFPGIYLNSGAPRISGTRITVYDIFYEQRQGDDIPTIAEWFGLTREQVEAAVAYIQAHSAEVEEVYKKIEERNARGNSPEVLERIRGSEGAAARMREKLRQERNGDQLVRTRDSS